MNNVMTIRDFTRNIYSHIHQNGVYVLTVNGEQSIVVTISKVPKGKGISVGKAKDNVTTYSGKYACGCKKGETKLCKTHHRT